MIESRLVAAIPRYHPAAMRLNSTLVPPALLASALLGPVLLATAGCPAPPPIEPQPPAPTSSASAAPPVEPDKSPAQQAMDDLAALRFDKLGNEVLRWDHIASPRAPRNKPHKLLVLLVDFPDRKFERFAGEADQGKKLASHFRQLLFDDSYQKPNTLSHYYATMSLGRYHIIGTVLEPLTLSKPRGAYGAPKRPAGGSWRNDTDSEGMVEEALRLLAKEHPNLPWKQYDQWDPQDFDGDGLHEEPDGYLDHFVLVYAGGGQASCNRIYDLQQVFTPNAKPDVLKSLDKREKECAERMWPHRFMVQRRDGQGPKIAGKVNAKGGVPLSETLWSRDYNMQSEYTGPSTFVHEFGHSVGLPDIYSRTSSNSTGSWEVMSSNSYSGPQSMSSWSRAQLGWLKPVIVKPPSHGGAKEMSFYLKPLDDPSADGEHRGALVVLPPKTVTVDLGGLPEASGKWALYSGQGNELNRTATLSVDLTKACDGPLTMSFDAWWEIEGGWDFAYVETSTDGGETWTRRLPTDRKHMPAKHGHDGKKTLPGFTGLSGDLDGDGKNESNKACDPKAEIPHGEDQAGKGKHPCKQPSWVKPSFDLSDLRCKAAKIRFRYFSDMAAVERGILIDNLTLSGKDSGGQDVGGDFEGAIDAKWKLDGFSKSGGRHELLVPHYYMIEYRDPYRDGAQHYDQALKDKVYRFYYHPEKKTMVAMSMRPRPGVLVWYFNGDYAWSENDPATNGPGKGYLLALDSNPNEIVLPGYEGWLKGEDASFTRHYDVSGDDAQAALKTAFMQTICFTRNPDYQPKWFAKDYKRKPFGCGRGKAPAGLRSVDGKSLLYSYELRNEYLPGTALAQKSQRIGELVERKKRKGKVSHRLRQVSLRYLHTLDAPFALEPFADGISYYEVTPKGLKQVSTAPHPAHRSFDDRKRARWLNPKLPFGGVAVPNTGFTFELQEPGADAPKGARVKVQVRWQETTSGS